MLKLAEAYKNPAFKKAFLSNPQQIQIAHPELLKILQLPEIPMEINGGRGCSCNRC